MYSGHGHAFASEDLVCCQQFAVPLFVGTAKEYKDRIAEDLIAYEPQWFTSDETLMAEAIDFLEEHIDEILNSLFDVADNEPALSEQEISDFGLDCDNDFIDIGTPYLLGYVHVYYDGNQ